MKIHVKNPGAKESLCGSTKGDIREMGSRRIVALTDDKCRKCMKEGVRTSIYFVDADRTRYLSPSEVATILNI